MMTDYDFRLGEHHLRGTGWRGLFALLIMATYGVVVILVLAAGVGRMQSAVAPMAGVQGSSSIQSR
jgi:hypothetical protein